MRLTASLIVAALFLIVVPISSAANLCLPMTDSVTRRLTEWVQKKYELPGAAKVELLSTNLSEETCYRRVTLFSKALPRGNEKLVFFLSPDQQFLIRDLVDLSVDPKEAELKEQQKLKAELTDGPFPRKGPQQALVTITIFSDFQCPYCRQAAEILNRDILPIESSPVQLVYRYLPLPVIEHRAFKRGVPQVCEPASEAGRG